MSYPIDLNEYIMHASGVLETSETRYQFILSSIGENNHLRTPSGRTFEGAIENFQARFFDPTLGISEAINVTNLFARTGDGISSEDTLTLDLTTRLVEDAVVYYDTKDGEGSYYFNNLTLPAEILPGGGASQELPFISERGFYFEGLQSDSIQSEILHFEPPINLVDGDNIEVPRRLEYIIHGDALSNLPIIDFDESGNPNPIGNIIELTLIIEDEDGDDTNGFQTGGVHIREDQIHDALNDIEFIIGNQLLGFSESNEENTGVIDRVRVTVDNGTTLVSSEGDINFQNSELVFTNPRNIITPKDLTSDGNSLIEGVSGSIHNGSDGDDVIVAGDGHDSITGGRGADILLGGLGRDEFIIEGDQFSGAYGPESDLSFDIQGQVLADQIFDFNDQEDVLILEDMRVNGDETISYHIGTGNVTLTDSESPHISRVIAKLHPGLDVTAIDHGNGDWSISHDSNISVLV